jgi:flagellar protein FlgJ
MIGRIQAAAPAPQQPQKIEEAAKQFEGLLFEQMLRSMRSADGAGWLGGGEDKAGESMIELAEQQFAMALAAGDGLGIATLITTALDKPLNVTQHAK